MAKQSSQRKRISLFAPGATEPTASVWATANLGENGGEVFLAYEYLDLAPDAGWQMECDGRRYDVRVVNARRLQCVAVQVS